MGYELLASAGGPESLAAASGAVRRPVDAQAPAVRLAHVLHWQGRFRDADVLFNAAIASASTIARAATDGWVEDQQRATATLAFALQHLPKSRFDEGPSMTRLPCLNRRLAFADVSVRRRIRSPRPSRPSMRRAHD